MRTLQETGGGLRNNDGGVLEFTGYPVIGNQSDMQSSGIFQQKKISLKVAQIELLSTYRILLEERGGRAAHGLRVGPASCRTVLSSDDDQYTAGGHRHLHRRREEAQRFETQRSLRRGALLRLSHAIRPRVYGVPRQEF